MQKLMVAFLVQESTVSLRRARRLRGRQLPRFGTQRLFLQAAREEHLGCSQNDEGVIIDYFL